MHRQFYTDTVGPGSKDHHPTLNDFLRTRKNMLTQKAHALSPTNSHTLIVLRSPLFLTSVLALSALAVDFSQPTHALHYCHHHVSYSSSLLSVSIIIPAYNNYTDAVYRRNSVNIHGGESTFLTRLLIRLIQPLTLRRLTQPRLTQPLNTAHSASAAGPCPAASIRLTKPPQQGPAQLPYTHIHTALSCHSLGAWQSN